MADGIPFTPAPRYEQQNPLQNISNLQGLAQREQAMEQQAITFGAKQALGQIMQKHIDPVTGEFDHIKAYGDMSSRPELAVIMPDVTEQFLRIPGIKAEALQKVVDYRRDKNMLDSEYHAEALRQMQVPGADPKSVALSLIAKRSNAGTISREEATQMTPSFIKLAENPRNFERALFQGAQFGKAAQESLDNAHAGLGYATEEVDVPDTRATLPDGSPNLNYGGTLKMPRYMAGGLTPKAQAIYGAQEQINAEPGGLAPLAAGEARQGGSPSVPPAARIVGTPVQSKNYRDYMEDTEGTKHWLRKEEVAAQDAANKAQAIETRMHKLEEVLRQFEQGPLMDSRIKSAEYLRGLGFPESSIKSLLGAKPGSKDALGAAQLARKYFYEGATDELQTTLPGLQKATNFDVQTVIKASPDVLMTKEGINLAMKNLKTVLDATKLRADFAGKFGPWSQTRLGTTESFNQSFYNKRLREALEHKGLAKTGPIDVSKKPGEK
jgi:hypothetical protein